MLVRWIAFVNNTVIEMAPTGPFDPPGGSRMGPAGLSLTGEAIRKKFKVAKQPGTSGRDQHVCGV